MGIVYIDLPYLPPEPQSLMSKAFAIILEDIERHREHKNVRSITGGQGVVTLLERIQGRVVNRQA